MSYFEKFKEQLTCKENFYSLLACEKKLVTKNVNMFLRFGTNLE